MCELAWSQPVIALVRIHLSSLRFTCEPNLGSLVSRTGGLHGRAHGREQRGANRGDGDGARGCGGRLSSRRGGGGRRDGDSAKGCGGRLGRGGGGRFRPGLKRMPRQWTPPRAGARPAASPTTGTTGQRHTRKPSSLPQFFCVDDAVLAHRTAALVFYWARDGGALGVEGYRMGTGRKARPVPLHPSSGTPPLTPFVIHPAPLSLTSRGEKEGNGVGY